MSSDSSNPGAGQAALVPETGGRVPRVVLAGRRNVGKSTLFNRLARRRRAVVDPTPGVTRDPTEATVRWGDHAVCLVDTGGFEAEGLAGLEGRVGEQTLAAVRDADLVLYVLDGRAGCSPADEAAARTLRRSATPVLWVVNKIDTARREVDAAEFYRLGATDLLPVSAEHGLGIGELVDAITARVRPAGAPAPQPGIRVGVIGRPNVGKSSLVNRLLGYERLLVDPTAGTTRDAVDTVLELDGTTFVLVDTAGIRRRSRIEERLERRAVARSMEALARSDIVVLVIDASEGLTTQDQRLGALAWEQGRGLLVAANKSDLAGARDPAALALRGLGRVRVLRTSARTGEGVAALLPAVARVAAQHAATYRTARLNEVLASAVRTKEPPLVRGRRLRLFYATQVGRRPPAITIFASAPTLVPASYQRYLATQLATAFGLEGTPLRITFRSRR